MRIGVLTFHRCINYGSYWQARCLVEALRTRGHDAVLLDHRSRRIDRMEWRCALRPVLPTPVPPADRALYAAKARRFFAAFDALPRSQGFDLDAPAQMEDFELVVVGSDEVWNLRHPWYGQHRLFFGEQLAARRLVAHAASFGSHAAAEGLAPAWAGRLRRFGHVSVRDHNSRVLVREALGIEPALVLDPCLQFPPRGEAPAAPACMGGAPYVAVYGHNFDEAFVRQLRRWAGRGGHRLVSIGYRNDWADAQWIDAGPEDFRAFMAGAQAVATNFFHGCVFALRYGKPFVCTHSPYRSLKIRDLMATLGADMHQIDGHGPPQALASRLEEPLAATILRRIEARRAVSDRSLEQALTAPDAEPLYAYA